MKTISKKPLLEFSTDCDSFEWDEFTAILGELVKKRFSEKGYAKVEAKNMGWRRASAWKVFKIADSPFISDLGDSFIIDIAPRCDWSATVYSYSNSRGLYINIKHHDNPVGGDEYYVLPISKRTYEKLRRS